MLVALVVLICYNPAPASQLNDAETWYNIYLDNHKAGYEWDKIKNTKYHDSDAYSYDSGGLMSMGIYPLINYIRTEDHLYLDTQFHPLEQSGKISFEGKNGSTFTTKTITYSVSFSDSRAICEVIEDGKTTRKTIRIPKDADMQSFWKIEMGLDGYKLDQIVKTDHFDSTELKLTRHDLKITKITEPEAGRRRIYQTDETDDKGNIKEASDIYKDKDTAALAEVYKSVPTTREDALSGMGAGGTYLTGGIPVDKQLPENGQICELTVQLISTMDEKLNWHSDNRQSVKQIDDGNTTEFKITAKPYDAKNSLQLPVTDQAFKDYLSEARGLEVKNREIADLARQIVGSETNAYKAASLLRNWISGNIEGYRNTGKKSALKTLHDMRGVCTDIAVLYVAMARSVGIPAKFVTGLMYSRDSFYNHAWVEVYVGEWVPIDPTLRTDFVDATHIKMKESASKELMDKPSDVDTGHVTAKIIAFTANIDKPIPDAVIKPEVNANNSVFDLPKPDDDFWSTGIVTYEDGDYAYYWFKHVGDDWTYVQKGKDGKIIRYKNKGGAQRNPPAEWLEPVK